MTVATIHGIKTNYEVIGNGPPLLMYAPAGFDATLDKWKTQGVYARIKLLDHLPKKYTCGRHGSVAQNSDRAGESHYAK